MCVSRLHRVLTSVDTGVVEVEDLTGVVSRASLLALDGAPAMPGDWVVVHSGYVVDRVDPVTAKEIADEVREALASSSTPTRKAEP
jgi:hydrogenase maturation factor